MTERWICFGRTTSGKTSLSRKLIEEFQKANPTAVTQVYDPTLSRKQNYVIPFREYRPLPGYNPSVYNEFLRFKME